MNIEPKYSNGTPAQMFDTSPSPSAQFRTSNEGNYSKIPLMKSPIEEKLSEEDEGEEGESDDDNPLLFVDVNLGPERSERIVVYDGDTAEGLADEFSKKHKLNQNMKVKLVQLLQSEISGLLSRIDEEDNSLDDN